MHICFHRSYALSPSGHCRPFDEHGDGTMLGESVCLLALKRLEDAEADQDPIYAVIKGYGWSSDGRSKSVYAPRPEGQTLAIRRAYAKTDYDLDSVSLMEAHGTATLAGDAAEVEGLKQAFAVTGRTDIQWCALGSVKSQIGHTKSAAGAVSLLKTALALHQQILPPTIKIDTPNPKLDFAASLLYLNTAARPWFANPQYPRRAAVSSMGFGGTNFHVTLEEYRSASAKRLPWAGRALLLLSAKTPDGLTAGLQNLRELLGKIVGRTRFNRRRQTQPA